MKQFLIWIFAILWPADQPDAVEGRSGPLVGLRVNGATALPSCVQNFSGSKCDHTVYLSVKKHSDGTNGLPKIIGVPLDLPYGVQVHFHRKFDVAAENKCGASDVADLLRALEEQAPKDDVTWVFRVPDMSLRCFSRQPKSKPLDRNHFWFIEGNKVVAHTKCNRIGRVISPHCQTNVYPLTGTYIMSFGSFPAHNIKDVLTSTSSFVERVVQALPEDVATELRAYSFSQTLYLSPVVAETILEYESAL